MRGIKFTFLAASLVLAMLWGCSSNRDGDDDSSPVQADPAFVGIDVCVQCHDFKGAEWLASRHGNPNQSPSSPHRPGESPCADCHNPLNDGDRIQFAFNTHEPRRDVVGCESCHGGGGNHFGLGPIPAPVPEPEVCGGCHNNINTVRNHSENGCNFIYDKWAGSRHAESLHGEDELPCQRCHTTEGALASNVAGYTGDADVLGDEDDLGRRAPPLIPEEDVTPISCRGCHDPHEAGQLREVWATDGEWDPNNNGSNRDQFDVCTSCHVLYNEEGTVVASGSEASGTAPFFHNTSWFRIIATTHYDNPATGPGPASNASALIEGYNIRWKGPNSEHPCFDCHGHEFRTATRPYPPGDNRDAPTIWTQWSSSAHAGHLFLRKLEAASSQTVPPGGDPASAPRSTATVDAVMAAGDDNFDDAWTHYNWDWTSSRGSCQQCHTATGVSNWLDAQIVNNDDDMENDVVYDPANNDYSHLANWSAATGSPQNEMLYCWGCHSNVDCDGELRNPHGLTLDFTYLEGPEQNPSGVADPVVLPDKGKANVCFACHGGRGNDTSIRQSYANDSLSSRFAGHHAPTAGSLLAEFTHTAFEFSGQNYAPPAFFVHDDILTNGDDPETGDGPCVGCHMGGVGNHTFEAVEHDSEGEVVEIVHQTLCNSCHGTAINPTSLEEIEDEFEDARKLLNDYATNTLPNYKGLDIKSGANRNKATLSLNDYGVFQNTLYFVDEPCVYVHNRYYGWRVLFDSIDWLDNGVLNGTITIDTAAYPGAAAWLQANGAGVATRP